MVTAMGAPIGNQNAVGNNGGRPTKYDPAFCAQVVELGKQGKSFTQIAVEIGYSKATLIGWSNQHLEFSTALTRAKECEQAWWEQKGMDGLTADKFNSAVWSKSMSARFRDDYTERREVAGVADQPIQVEDKSMTPRSLAREIAFALAAGMRANGSEVE